MRLTDEQLRDVLARAEEIQRESRYGDEITVDLETVIGAAEEMVSRGPSSNARSGSASPSPLRRESGS